MQLPRVVSGQRAAYCAVVVGALAWAEAAAQETWPEFRGPHQGVSDARDVPWHWSDVQHVAWKRPLEGNGWSSPALVDGQIFLTAAVPLGDARSGGYSLRLLCLSAQDGQTRWQRELFAEPPNAPGIHSKNSHASPTPLIRDGRVYAFFGHQGLACVDVQGNIVWKHQRYRYAPVHGNGGSPALDDGVLVINCDGADAPFVAAMDAATGDELWKAPRRVDAGKTFSFSTPLVIEEDGRKLVVSAGSNVVSALDLHSGEELWRVRYDGYSVIPRPVLAENLLFVATGYDSPQLLAIRLHGRGDVSQSHVAWRYQRRAPHTPTPVCHHGRLYLVSDRGVATCLRAVTGEQLWQERLSGNFSASPLIADERVYFQSEEGDGYVVREGDRYELLATNRLGERTLATYAVEDGALYIRSDQHLFKIVTPQSATPGGKSP